MRQEILTKMSEEIYSVYSVCKSDQTREIFDEGLISDTIETKI